MRVNATVRYSEQPSTADDVFSADPATVPAELVAADPRGDSPRANDHGVFSQEEYIHSGDSDGGSDSKKSPRSPESQGATEKGPINRNWAGSQSYGHYYI